VGTGSGILLLLLARACPGLVRGVGIEIQRELWECARRNISENGLDGRLVAALGDYRNGIPERPRKGFDLVVSNPPYRPAGSGRRNPDPQKETARHEVAGTLADLFAAAARALAPGGVFALVAPCGRLPEIVARASASGIGPETVRFVHPFPGSRGDRVLFAGIRGRTPGTAVLPPLFVRSGKGRYHPEITRLFGRMGVR
jgi:tRNA1(Val) A37 N6-methylase TrmN6